MDPYMDDVRASTVDAKAEANGDAKAFFYAEPHGRRSNTVHSTTPRVLTVVQHFQTGFGVPLQLELEDLLLKLEDPLL